MNIEVVALVLHLLSAVIWVGGMFFAYMCLRPVAGKLLEPPQRLTVWQGVFSLFFPYVWIAVILLPATGYLLAIEAWQMYSNAPLYIHLMNGIGTLMILIYMHVFFVPYKRIKQFIIIEDWPSAAKQLNQIRQLIALNLSLGIIVIVIAAAGRKFI